MNNYCHKNCDDCYVNCSDELTNVKLSDIEAYIRFLFKHNKSDSREINIDFMGGEMSKYPHLYELAKLLNKVCLEFNYKVNDVRVTTYLGKSDDLILFCKTLNYKSLRFYIIRNLLESNIFNDIEYCKFASRLRSASVVLEHVFRSYQIPHFKQLLDMCKTYEFIHIDICYPCGDIGHDFTSNELDLISKIYYDFIRVNEVDADFTRRVYLGQVDHSINYCELAINTLNTSKCNPFTEELWLSPRGNIIPCAHLVKYDKLFDHNNINVINKDSILFFTNIDNIKYISQSIDSDMCEHCIVKPWCVNCRILPELMNIASEQHVVNSIHKCNRTLTMVKVFMQNEDDL